MLTILLQTLSIIGLIAFVTVALFAALTSLFIAGLIAIYRGFRAVGRRLTGSGGAPVPVAG